jgi:hypothetical protein
MPEQSKDTPKNNRCALRCRRVGFQVVSQPYRRPLPRWTYAVSSSTSRRFVRTVNQSCSFCATSNSDDAPPERAPTPRQSPADDNPVSKWGSTIAAAAGAAATFFVTFDSVFKNAAPPGGPDNGPSFVAAYAQAIVALLILTVYMLSATRATLFPWQGVACVVGAILFYAVYFGLRDTYVFNYPAGPTGIERIAGLTRNPIPDYCAGKTGDADLLFCMNGETSDIWTADSIRHAKMVLCFLYCVFAMAFAAACFVPAEIIRASTVRNRPGSTKA